MRKWISALIAVLMTLFLVACTNTETQHSEDFQLPTVSNEQTVERTLPSIYVTEDIHHFDAVSYAQEQEFYSVTYDDINDTFLLVMSGERYNRLVSELVKNIDYALSQIVASEAFSYIKNISYTQNMDTFTLLVDRNAYLATEDYTPEYIESFVAVYRALLELPPQISFSIVAADDNTELGFVILPEEE